MTTPKEQETMPAPTCEQCNEIMHPYTDPSTGVDGWACDLCGWSEDDGPERVVTPPPPDPERIYLEPGPRRRRGTMTEPRKVWMRSGIMSGALHEGSQHDSDAKPYLLLPIEEDGSLVIDGDRYRLSNGRVEVLVEDFNEEWAPAFIRDFLPLLRAARTEGES